MEVAVEPGDYIVLSTDGLFDNVPDPMIIEEVVSIRVRYEGCFSLLFYIFHVGVLLDMTFFSSCLY